MKDVSPEEAHEWRHKPERNAISSIYECTKCRKRIFVPQELLAIERAAELGIDPNCNEILVQKILEQ